MGMRFPCCVGRMASQPGWTTCSCFLYAWSILWSNSSWSSSALIRSVVQPNTHHMPPTFLFNVTQRSNRNIRKHPTYTRAPHTSFWDFENPNLIRIIKPSFVIVKPSFVKWRISCLPVNFCSHRHLPFSRYDLLLCLVQYSRYNLHLCLLYRALFGFSRRLLLEFMIRLYKIPSCANICSRYPGESARSEFPFRFVLYYDSFCYSMQLLILDLLGINPSQLCPNS